MSNMSNKMTSPAQTSSPAPRSAAEVFFAAHRCRIGAMLGVGRIGGWSLALTGLLVASLTQGALAGPEGAQVARGDVNITRNGAETLIRAGRNSIINYRSFDIAKGETVRFVQPDSMSRVLNRIYSAQPTRIDGSLIANGRVYIVNPSGVLFSASARVDVNGLYAAAGKLSDSNFLRGINSFTDTNGSVVNEGTITADFVGLLGKSVGNSGTINAPQGTVVMASGDSMLVGDRSGGVYVKVTGKADDLKGPATDNTGTINATGGSVNMAAGDVYSMAMRVGGNIRAKNVRAQGTGKGEVHVTGTIDASTGSKGGAGESGKGGRVELLGEKVALAGATINASGVSGGGDVRIGGDIQGKGILPTSQKVYMGPDSSINVDATQRGDGGTAVIWSENFSRVYGDITARGGISGGNGGFIETSSHGLVDLSSKQITAGAVSGNGGRWLIDPRTVNITAAGADDGSVVSGTFFPNADNANVNVSTIHTAINNDTSIIISTFDAGGAQAGDINVNAPITKSAGVGAATLTLQAANDVNVNSAITSTSGVLNVVLRANHQAGDDLNSTAGNVNVGANISTNGGSFTSSGVDFTSTASGTITATGGVTINHSGSVTIGAAVVSTGNIASITGSSVTANSTVDAGAAAVNFTTDAIAINADITGNAVTIANKTAATTVGVAGGAGALSVSNGELGHLITTGTVTIGSSTAGAVTTSVLDLPTLTQSFPLTLSGASITTAGIIMDTGDLLKLSAATGGVTQSGTIITSLLELTGAGTFALTNTTNQISTIAGNVNGAITVVNDAVTALDINSAGGSNTLSSNGNAISLRAAAGISATNAIDAAGGTLTLTTDAVTLNADLTGSAITIANATAATTVGVAGGAGSLNLTTGELQRLITTGTVTIGSPTAGALTTNAFSLPSLAVSYSLRLSGASIATGGIALDSGDLLTLLAATGGVSQSGPISADVVQITGTGAFNLANTNNQIGTIGGSVSGAITVTNAAGAALTIGNAGNATNLVSGGNAIILTAPTGITVTNPVNAGASPVTFTTNSIAINANVTGSAITIANSTAATTVGVAGGAGALNLTTAELQNLITTGTVTIGSATAGAVTTNAFSLPTLTVSYPLTLSGASIATAGITMDTGDLLTLTAASGGVTQTGGIIANLLQIIGTGSFNLGSASNQIGTIGGSVTGAITVTNASGTALTIGNAGTATNLASGGSAIILTAPAGITVTNAVNAGAAPVTLTTDAVAINANVTGNAITIANSTAATTVGVAGGAGTLNITTSELQNLITTGTVTIGSATAGAVTTNAFSLPTLTVSYPLTLSGASIATAGITMDTGDLLTLIAASGGVSQSGGVIANLLQIIGTGAFNLASTNNQIGTIGGSVTGAITVTNASGTVLTIGNAGTATNLASGGSAIILNAPTGITVTNAVNAGAAPVTMNTDAVAINANVTGSAITIANSTASTTVGIAGAAGALNLATAELQNLITTGTVTIGSGTAGALSTNVFSLPGLSLSYPLTLTGASVTTAGITMDTGDLLTLSSAATGVTQSGAIAADFVQLTGGGSFVLANPSNQIGTIGGSVTGTITIANASGTALTIGNAGSATNLASGGSAIIITAPAGITVTNPVNAGAAPVSLTTDSIAINANVTGNAITISNFNSATTVGVAGGAGTLNLTTTELQNLITTGTVTIGSATAGAVTTNAFSLPTLTVSYPLTLSGASVTTAGITMDTGDLLTLTAASGGVTQTGGIIANLLQIIGTGTFNLGSTSNQVGTIGGSVTGAITVTNATGSQITIGNAGAATNLASGGNAIILTAPAGIIVNNPVNAGAAPVTLNTDGAGINANVTGNAITIANSTAATTVGIAGGAGTLNLTTAELQNLITTGTVTIGSATAGAVTTNAIDLPTLTLSYPLTLSGASIASGGITMDTGDLLTLTAASGGVTQTGGIIANLLQIIGTGAFNLGSTSNQIGTIGGSVTGAVTVTNASGTALTIGNAGTATNLASGGSAIILTAPAGITVTNAVNAGAAPVTLTTDTIAINANVTGNAITVANSTATTTVGVAGGFGALNLSTSELQNLITTGTVTIGSATAGAVTTNAFNLPSLGVSYPLTLSGASILTSGITMDTGDLLTLSAASGGVTQFGAIVAGLVQITGAGSFALSNTGNQIGTIVGAVNGAITIVNTTSALTINNAGTATTLSSNGNAISITAAAGVTVSVPVTAGSGRVTIAADTIDIGASVTGNATASGPGINLHPVTAGTTVGIGNGSGTFSLTQTELNFLSTTSGLTIGVASTADTITIGSATFAGLGGDVCLTGSNMTIATLTGPTGRSLVLVNNAGTATQTGGITATNLGLSGLGAFDLQNSSNAVSGNFASNSVGATQFQNSSTLTLGTVTADCGGSPITNTSNGLLCAPSVTISNALGASDITIKTDTLAVNADINATNLTIQNITSGRTIGLGGGVGDLNIDDAEIAHFNVTGLLTIGTATAGAITSESVNFGGAYNATLIGASIATNTGLSVGSARTLTLNAITGGVTQGTTGAGITADQVILTGAGDFRLPNESNAIGNLRGTVSGVIQVVDNVALTINGTGLNSTNHDISILAPIAFAAISDINAGTASVSIGTDSIAIAADITGNAGMSLFPFSEPTTVGLGGGAGTFNLVTSELGHLISTGVVEIGLGSVGAGAANIGAIDFSSTGINRTYSLLVNGSSIDAAALTFQGTNSLALNAVHGDITLTGAVVAPGGFHATAVAISGGRGVVILQDNITTSSTPILIEADARVAGPNVVLSTLGSGTGAAISFSGAIAGTADNTEALSLLGGTGNVTVGGTFATGSTLGQIGSNSLALRGLTVTGATVSLPSIFVGAGGVNLTGDSFISLVTTQGSVSIKTTNGGNIDLAGAGTANIAGTIDSAGYFKALNTGTTTLAGASITTAGGLVDFANQVSLGANVLITTAGGSVTFRSSVDGDVTANNRDLTINAGSGGVEFRGTVGTSAGALIRTLSSTAAATTVHAVHTTGAQTYTGNWSVLGTVLADSGDVHVTGGTTVAANSTVTASSGSILLDGAVDSSSETSDRFTLSLTASNAVTIGGEVGFVTKLQSFAASGGTVSTHSVKAIDSITFTGATSLDEGSGTELIDAAVVQFNDPVTLKSTTVVNGTTSVTFNSTVISEASEHNDFTINSPITTLAGAIGGASGAGNEIGVLTTDDGGTLRLGSSTVRTTGNVRFGDATTLIADVEVNSGASVTFASTINSDTVAARALAVNTTGAPGNTQFSGNIGEGAALASLTTNANGTTFLPAIIRTTGAQVYLDDVRLTGDDTVLTAGSFNFDKTINSDSSSRALTLNASGQTRLGGAVGNTQALTRITTDSAGTLLLGGNVTTTSSQSYGEDTQLLADVVLTGNGITFANSIRSLDSGPALRALTIAGGAGGVTVSGSMGVGSDLASLNVTGNEISVRAVTTDGSQTFTGRTTVTGDLTARNGNLTVNGPASVTGNIQAQNVRFQRADSLTPAPATLAGNITSLLANAVISFSDDLSLASNVSISGNNAAVTFGGAVSTSGVTKRALQVSTSGATIFQGRIGDNSNELASLVTQGGGTVRFNAGFIKSTGAIDLSGPTTFSTEASITGTAIEFRQALTLGGSSTSVRSTINGTTVAFDGTVNGDAAGRDLTIVSTGDTSFRGAVGSSATPLGRLIVNKASNSLTTNINASIFANRGMVFGGPVKLNGTSDITIDGGNGSLFFRSTIDAASGAAPQRITLLSKAPVKINRAGATTDVSDASDGSTSGDVTVTPFRFGGSIGASSALNALTIGAADSLGASPVAASAVYSNSFNADGAITSGSLGSFVVQVTGTNNSFVMGKYQKLSAFGNIDIRATGGAVTLSDLSSLSTIAVSARTIALQDKTVPSTAVLTNKTAPVNVREEFRTDIVAAGRITITMPNAGDEVSGVGLFASSGSQQRPLHTSTSVFGLYEEVQANGSKIQPSITAANQFKGTGTFFLPLDLVASANPTNAASVLAGAIPRDNREREVTQAVLLSPAFGKTLENIQLFTRELTPQALSEFLIGRAIYEDVPQMLNPANNDRKVSTSRLSNQPVLAAIRSYCDLAYDDGETAFNLIAEGKPLVDANGKPLPERLDQIKRAVSAAWDEYVKDVGEAGASGRGFRQQLEDKGDARTADEKLALTALNKARTLLQRVDEIGLSPAERKQVREGILINIGGGGIKDLESAVVGQLVAMGKR